MTEQKPIKYALYAVKLAKLTPDSLNAHEFNYIGFGRNYSLIYTDKELQEPYKKLPEDIELTADERQWFTAVKLQINKRYLQDNEQDIVPMLESLTDELEKSLKEEAEKLKGEQPK